MALALLNANGIDVVVFPLPKVAERSECYLGLFHGLPALRLSPIVAPQKCFRAHCIVDVSIHSMNTKSFGLYSLFIQNV